MKHAGTVFIHCVLFVQNPSMTKMGRRNMKEFLQENTIQRNRFRPKHPFTRQIPSTGIEEYNIT